MEKTNKNRRERKRVKALNGYFADLRKRLPRCETQAKTKAQILFRAAEYIDYLEGRIDGPDSQQSKNINVEKIEEQVDRPSCRFSKVGTLSVPYLLELVQFEELVIFKNTRFKSRSK